MYVPAAPAPVEKPKPITLRTTAKDFKPKPVPAKPTAAAESTNVVLSKDSKPFSPPPTAKPFKPAHAKEQTAAKESAKPTTTSSTKENVPIVFVVKTLVTTTTGNLQNVYKQFDKKKPYAPAAKESWPTSADITIKEPPKTFAPTEASQMYMPPQPGQQFGYPGMYYDPNAMFMPYYEPNDMQYYGQPYMATPNGYPPVPQQAPYGAAPGYFPPPASSGMGGKPPYQYSK